MFYLYIKKQNNNLKLFKMNYLNLVELNKGLNEAKKKIKTLVKEVDDEKIIIGLNNSWINVNYENEDLIINIELSELNGKLFITLTEIFED